MAATAHITASNTRQGHGLSALIENLRRFVVQRRTYRRTLSELQSLSTKDLADLGLNRSMLRRIAWQAAYEQNTEIRSSSSL